MFENERERKEVHRIYCSNGVHPTFVFEKVRYLILETLDHFVDALLPRRFDIFLLLNGVEKFSQCRLNDITEADGNLRHTNGRRMNREKHFAHLDLIGSIVMQIENAIQIRIGRDDQIFHAAHAFG